MRTLKQIEADIESAKLQMAPYQQRLNEFLKEKEEFRREEWRQRLAKAQIQAKQRQEREKRSKEQFSSVKVGDMVRLRGTRDTKNPWRLVQKVYNAWGSGNPNSVYGQKFGRKADGTWIPYPRATQNGIEKIVELIPAEELKLA